MFMSWVNFPFENHYSVHKQLHIILVKFFVMTLKYSGDKKPAHLLEKVSMRLHQKRFNEMIWNITTQLVNHTQDACNFVTRISLHNRNMICLEIQSISIKLRIFCSFSWKQNKRTGSSNCSFIRKTSEVFSALKW